MTPPTSIGAHAHAVTSALTQTAPTQAPAPATSRWSAVPHGYQRAVAALKHLLRRGDTLAIRVMVPPLLVWAALYLLVEFLL